jgi:hypothetical protein
MRERVLRTRRICTCPVGRRDKLTRMGRRPDQHAEPGLGAAVTTPDAVRRRFRRLLGDEPGSSAARGAGTRCSATACSTQSKSSAPISGCRPTSSTTAWSASTTSRSSYGSSTTANTCTRACTTSPPPYGNRVRDELRHFGYFVTESPEHFAECSREARPPTAADCSSWQTSWPSWTDSSGREPGRPMLGGEDWLAASLIRRSDADESGHSIAADE